MPRRCRWLFLMLVPLVMPGLAPAQVKFGQGKPSRYPTAGRFMFGMSFESGLPFDVDHTVELMRFVSTPSGPQPQPYDSTYRVSTGISFLIGLRGGMSVTPWLTPYFNFSLGRGGRRGEKKWIVDHIYSDIGTRINAAIPNWQVVPYVFGALTYRSLDHTHTTGSSTSGNTTTIYYDTEEWYSGGARSYGAGVLVKAVDIALTRTVGTPKPYEDGVNARNTTMTSTRLQIGFSAYVP